MSRHTGPVPLFLRRFFGQRGLRRTGGASSFGFRLIAFGTCGRP